MLKLGIKLLFVIGSQLIITAICAEQFPSLLDSLLLKITIILELFTAGNINYLGRTGMNKNSKDK